MIYSNRYIDLLHLIFATILKPSTTKIAMFIFINATGIYAICVATLDFATTAFKSKCFLSL